MEGLEWQTIEIPFAAGINTKAHKYALEPPGLLVCNNVEFDEAGALRLRRPFVGIGTDIYPSGSISNGTGRKLAVLDNELVLFTKDTIYSWNDTINKWVSRGTHLAVATEEATRFGNNFDQVFADRAQLSGLIVYVWLEVQSSTVTIPYLAAIDSVTGATIISPTSFGGSTYSRPRVVALDTKILVTWTDTSGVNGLFATTIDPATPTFTTSGPTTIASVGANAYDIVKDPSADRAVAVVRDTGGANYTVARVTAALAVTTSAKARTADGIVALAVAPSGQDRVQILRTSGNNVVGDLLVVSTLADVFTATAVGSGTTTINQLTGAYRSVTDGGFFRCYAFWSAGETTGTTIFENESNWVDTNNSVGTTVSIAGGNGVGSRAFGHDGRVYVWSVFAGQSTSFGSGVALGIRAQMQNTYHLHRDDGFMVAKAAWSKAGGFGKVSGLLPGVALVSGTTGYAWCGVERQIIVVGGADRSNYGARAPRDILLTFDSDAARRTVQLGRTLYVSGGMILQYDGEGLTEVGSEQYPWAIGVVDFGAGAMAAGKFSYKATYRWDNAKGETERSTTATGEQITQVANRKTTFTVAPVQTTRKTSTRRNMAIEVWRTKVDPNIDFPFYLVTSKDPAVAGDNAYVENTPGAFVTGFDNLTDAQLEEREQNPENAATLPRLAPPPASILCASDTRLFLAGVAGEPHRIWYSLQRADGEIAAFHPVCSISLPSSTGAITALAFLNETLIAFTATAIYAIPGDGFDNTGGGANYGPPRLLSSDVGAISHDIVALTPSGLIFGSRKGWYRLGSGWALEYIGAQVERMDTDEGNPSLFKAVQVVESQHQVRFLSEGVMLVWDYLIGAWARWSEGGYDMAQWNGANMSLGFFGVLQQATVLGAGGHDFTIETGWIKLNGLQGFGRIRWIEVIGEFKAAHRQRIKVARDGDSAFIDDRTLVVAGSIGAGNSIRVRQGLTQQRVAMIKVSITILNSSGGNPDVDPVVLVGLALEVGIKRGLYRRLPAAQKQ